MKGGWEAVGRPREGHGEAVEVMGMPWRGYGEAMGRVVGGHEEGSEEAIRRPWEVVRRSCGDSFRGCEGQGEAVVVLGSQ